MSAMTGKSRNQINGFIGEEREKLLGEPPLTGKRLTGGIRFKGAYTSYFMKACW